jgi:cell wall-associated NlpC family hydrolase
MEALNLESLNLKTGDLILFSSNNSGLFALFDKLIKLFTNSDYNHIGMVLKDPTFIDENLKGLYLYESSWEGEPDPADGKIKLGVQITPLEEAFKNNPGNAYLRRIIAPTDNEYTRVFAESNIIDVYKKTNAKPYDLNPVDWIEAFFRIDPTFKFGKDKRFFCSALVGYIYQQLGILQKNTDWSILRPSDFSLEDNNRHIFYENGFKLDTSQETIY